MQRNNNHIWMSLWWFYLTVLVLADSGKRAVQRHSSSFRWNSTKSIPVLGRGQHLEWCCQVYWEAQRCCSCTCSTAWSPLHQGCWTASSSPSLSCLQENIHIINLTQVFLKGSLIQKRRVKPGEASLPGSTTQLCGSTGQVNEVVGLVRSRDSEHQGTSEITVEPPWLWDQWDKTMAKGGSHLMTSQTC